MKAVSAPASCDLVAASILNRLLGNSRYQPPARDGGASAV
jgi:hypothetical protein